LDHRFQEKIDAHPPHKSSHGQQGQAVKAQLSPDTLPTLPLGGRELIQVDSPSKEIDSRWKYSVNSGKTIAAELAQDGDSPAPDERIALHVVDAGRFQAGYQSVEQANDG
jgi:hypothetical protein